MRNVCTGTDIYQGYMWLALLAYVIVKVIIDI